MVKLELDTVFKLNVLALVVALISCNKQGAPDCFTAAGEKSSEFRVLESFSNLELYHEIHYTLVDTNFCGILVEGPINLIDKINAQVSQNKLVIRNNNTCNFIRSFDQDFHVTIYFSELNEVINFSSGKIDCAAKIKGTHLMW
ncbi:MAG: GIN domain-containing protein, partial [Bacteroidota bacterium]